MRLEHFSNWLRELLRPDQYKDYCPNGLCVEGSDTVTGVVTGVSFRMELIQEAIRVGANCIVVHHPHGFWQNEPRLPIGTLSRKLKVMYENGISLYGFHLPLDGHQEIGNNVLIAQGLQLTIDGTFMREGMADIGVLARATRPFSKDQLKTAFTSLLGHPLVHEFWEGPDEINRIAICSGGGASGFSEAARLGVDAFLTGEVKESTPIWAREEQMHILAGGHHRTEVFGVRALAERIKTDLKLPSFFHDIDNPV